jgi:hypothetical protein
VFLSRSLITKTSFGPGRKKLVAGGACPEPVEWADPGAGLSEAGYNEPLFLRSESEVH